MAAAHEGGSRCGAERYRVVGEPSRDGPVGPRGSGILRPGQRTLATTSLPPLGNSGRPQTRTNSRREQDVRSISQGVNELFRGNSPGAPLSHRSRRFYLPTPTSITLQPTPSPKGTPSPRNSARASKGHSAGASALHRHSGTPCRLGDPTARALGSDAAKNLDRSTRYGSGEQSS
jgi:hypothetical protein